MRKTIADRLRARLSPGSCQWDFFNSPFLYAAGPVRLAQNCICQALSIIFLLQRMIDESDRK